MTDKWLYRPRPAKEPDPPPASLLPVPVALPAPPAPPPPPPFNTGAFDRACARIADELYAMSDAGAILPFSSPYDPRLDVLRGHFAAYAAGIHSEGDVLRYVRAETAAIADDNPVAAVLGYEVAKAGFLAMGQPTIASEFAGRAALHLRRLKGRLALPPGESQPERS